MTRTVRGLTAALLVAGVMTCAAPARASAPHVAPPASAAVGTHVQLPRDEAAHNAPTEWWYFNGHLSAVDAAGRTHRYGFEYVTFQFRSTAADPVYIANLSVTDLTRHRFVYSAQMDSYPTPQTKNSFDLHTGPWTMTGSGRHDALSASLPGYALNLQLRTTGLATLHGTAGEIPFGPFGRSAYYSFTSLSAGGTLVDHGVRMRVRGMSWMDHQWGPIDFSRAGGWDWFSIQLTNKTRYMLYFIRNSVGRIVATVGTRIGATQQVTHLKARSFGERINGRWHSSVTGITYSSGWRVRVPGGSLNIKPLLVDQELDLRQVQGVAYWEGDVAVHGRIHGHDVHGVGYTEINPAGQP